MRSGTGCAMSMMFDFEEERGGNGDSLGGT
jgi:hypothetical protein